ncbi:MAG TPA: serine/threonine-protein kinase [Solirubrobacterales bacterium]|nr:serine/threonine-protein kinase [Solirubrobacterales bacterium]
MSETGRNSNGQASGGKPLRRDPRFKLLEREPLGKGGKAQIWKVEDLATTPYVPGGIVAVKEPRPHSTSNDLQRLRREGRQDRRFDHENVVRIFDLRGGPRSPFLVMEYIDGEDLERLLARYQRFDPERVIEVGIQLCAAMQCLHLASLIHRDIKPGNLMLIGDVGGDGSIRLKLIDLGIAQAPDEIERATENEVLGTEPYIAPEVRRAEQATEASDIYAAGAVLYELATGLKLSSLSEEEVLQRRRHKSLDPPHRVNPAVPEWLSAVIMRAIEVGPGKRFYNAAGMQRALEERVATFPSEDATTVISTAYEAPTRVINPVGQTSPATEGTPFVFRLLNYLPLWMRQRLPEEIKDNPLEGYGFLLMLASAVILITAVYLPIEIRVAETLLAIPPWLLTTGLLSGCVAVWFLRDETRRRTATRAIRLAGGRLQIVGRQLQRMLVAGGGGLWRALRAIALHLAAVATSAWRRLEKVPWKIPAPPVRESDNQRRDDGWVGQVADLGRRIFSDRGEPRGGTVRQSTADPWLRGARLQLAEVGIATRAWVPWLGRRAFLIVLGALTVCLALWLSPPLQNEVAQRPADHRAVLTVIPAALWMLVALGGLLRLRARRTASPRQLVTAGIVLLALLAVLGGAMPSFSSWLETRFWPESQVQKGAGHSAGHATSPTATSPPASPQQLHREAARADSRKLATRVRTVEGTWMQLLRSLRHDDWSVAANTKAAVRETAAALVARLNSWTTLRQYESARVATKHWSKSMEHAGSRLATHDCRSFNVGPRGALTRC